MGFRLSPFFPLFSKHLTGCIFFIPVHVPIGDLGFLPKGNHSQAENPASSFHQKSDLKRACK